MQNSQKEKSVEALREALTNLAKSGYVYNETTANIYLVTMAQLMKASGIPLAEHSDLQRVARLEEIKKLETEIAEKTRSLEKLKTEIKEKEMEMEMEMGKRDLPLEECRGATERLKRAIREFSNN